jgi:hypothetical protein
MKLDTNHAWVKGQILFKGGDDYNNAKMGCSHLKIFFFRTTEPE